MEVKKIICDICKNEIPLTSIKGNVMFSGCEYIEATIENTRPVPPRCDGENREKQKIHICPWCKEEIARRSIKARKKEKR